MAIYKEKVPLPSFLQFELLEIIYTIVLYILVHQEVWCPTQFADC